MSNNLRRQLSMIQDANPMAQQMKRAIWARAHQERCQFLEQLNAALDKDGLTGKKRSKAYSASVVEYDRKNRIEGWNE